VNLAKIHRLLQLIGLLQSRGANIESLALECSVSRRTIFRDLDLLRQSGVTIHLDEKLQCYRIPGACLLPPTNFTPEEALALVVICHEIGDNNGLPFLSAARSAAVKLESALPTRLREQLRTVASTIYIKSAPLNPLQGCKPIYDQLLDAIARCRSVRIHYRSLQEEGDIVTRLNPYRLFLSRGA
jgi:predicted DNA-binding transcriptional regulator YafY